MFNKVSKKISAIVIALALVLTATIGIMPLDVKAAGPKTITVSYTAQFDGAFKDVEINDIVSGDTAENAGYSDTIDSDVGVSLLDVIVKMHQNIFGAAFDANPTAYLVISGGWMTNVFGKVGAAAGYYVNTGIASGLYTALNDNDVVDLFIYTDALGYTDTYTFFKDYSINEGKVSAKLCYIGWDSYYNPVEVPLANANLAWYNADTKEITQISGVKTAADGSFTVDSPSVAGSYYVTLYDSTVGTAPSVRSILLKYNIVSELTVSTKTDAQVKSVYDATGKYLNDSIDGEYGDEWVMLGLCRGDYPVSSELKSHYYNDVVRELKANSGTLHTSSSDYSNYARTVIGINAAGYEASDVAGYNLVDKVNDYSAVSAQGINGTMYALLALDTKNYESSAREKYIADILSAQTSVGGWGYVAGTNDVDMTGIALTALAPYYNSNSSVKSAVDKALVYLSTAQNSDGTFSSYGSKNSNSIAMVVTGLTALGINPDTDTRFIKNGISALDALVSYAMSTGEFGYTNDTTASYFSTLQAYYALVSYYRMIGGQSRLFDMTITAATPDTAAPKTGDNLYLYMMLIILSLGLGCFMIRRSTKH